MESIRRVASVVPPVLMVLLLMGPTVGADRPPAETQGCRAQPGEIFLPTGTATAPPFLTQLTQKSYAFFVSGVAAYQDDPYLLVPGGGTSSSTINDRTFPDFHVQWLVENGPFWSQVGISNDPGIEIGKRVPPTATAALVWMQYGPDTGTADRSAGATFVLYLGTC